MDNSTPVSANMEPTDKSMPPVMMTNPMPRLNTPNNPIMFAMFVRLVRVMKRGSSSWAGFVPE